MLVSYLVIFWLVTVLLGITLSFLTTHYKFPLKKERKIILIAIISFALSAISIVGAGIEKEIEKKESSTSYYYEMLEHKTFIEKQLEAHKEEIEAIKTVNVEGVSFEFRNEINNLQNTIKDYNATILQQRTYKNSYWFNKRYNESVANLNTFEEIF